MPYLAFYKPTPIPTDSITHFAYDGLLQFHCNLHCGSVFFFFFEEHSFSESATCNVIGEIYALLLEQSFIPALQSTMRYNSSVYARWCCSIHRPLPETSAAISGTTKSYAGNFLKIGLLEPPTYILVTFSCGDTSWL